MSFILAALRTSQIALTDIIYTERLITKKSKFSGRPNPYRTLPRSYLLMDCLVQRKRQRFLYRLGTPLRLLGRLSQLSLIFVPVCLIVIPISVFFPYDQQRRQQIIYYLFNWCLVRAGATFTKLGQWASTRPDILPWELCSVLSGLHTKAPAHGMAWNRDVFRAEFGVELEEIFDDFESEPTGSGTIAQVHRAKLRRNGLDVAVKICHPDIEEYIERDLKLMTVTAELLNLFPSLKPLCLPEEVWHFARLMRQQLDLRHEAYTLDHFGRNFSSWKTINVPLPLYPYVSPRVLTETFAQGVSIGAFAFSKLDESLTDPEREVWRHVKKQIATIGLQSFLQMLLWDNFVHADLHPGNILVRFVDRKGIVRWEGPPSARLVHHVVQKDLSPQLVYLDTGLITVLSRKDFKNFNDLFTTLILFGDGYKAGQLIIERCPPRYRPQIVDPDGFCHSMDEIIGPIFRDISLKLASFAIAPVLFKVFDLVRDHHVHLDGAFTNLVMSFVCVEGLGRQLTPDLNLIPFLAKAALQYLVTNVAMTIDDLRDRKGW